MKRALIIVDVQNDFLPGGSLGIEGGFEIIDIINRIKDKFDFVLYTQDWHPEDHCSFKDWPVHCVQNTFGAKIHKDLKTEGLVLRKGFHKDIDSYSAFYDNNHQHASGLTKLLEANNVKDVTVVGLAYNYCVAYTALDSVKEGFKTIVLKEACKSIGTIEEVNKVERDIITAGVIIDNYSL